MTAGAMTGDHTRAMIAGDHDASSITRQMSLEREYRRCMNRDTPKGFCTIGPGDIATYLIENETYTFHISGWRPEEFSIAHGCQKTYTHQYTLVTWVSDYHLCLARPPKL